MGGQLSSHASSDQIAWHFPSWCIDKCQVTPDLISLVTASWERCMSGESTPYLTAHTSNPSLTPLVLFYDTFYARLFDWLPQVKPLFHNNMHRQGKMLANIVRFIVHNPEPQNKLHFVENLTRLTKAHNAIGVTAQHYSVMGMTLIHTVRKCMGDEEFTDAHRHAWIVVYSKMMEVMIPVAVSGALPEADKGGSGKGTIQVKPIWHAGDGKLADGKDESTASGTCPVAHMHSRVSH